MINPNTIDLDNGETLKKFTELSSLINPKSPLLPTEVKNILNSELEIKRAAVKLSFLEAGKLIINSSIKKDNFISVDYSWTPRELFEDLQKFLETNIKFVSENFNNDGFWTFTISIRNKNIEFEAEFPEDVVELVYNPLLKKHTDMIIMYTPEPNGFKEIHEFIFVKIKVGELLKKAGLYTFKD